eukprot:TRINITY_DN11937_c0_g1_i1.p1 TRINITY_DN11937_c0_g1~~TRINITY_DN11937_c0_g1_i1.p1  ORF type:complete len:171 (-),score=33.22 TRINITY_DN11937_c0_g1_i1:36-548(-)
MRFLKDCWIPKNEEDLCTFRVSYKSVKPDRKITKMTNNLTSDINEEVKSHYSSSAPSYRVVVPGYNIDALCVCGKRVIVPVGLTEEYGDELSAVVLKFSCPVCKELIKPSNLKQIVFSKCQWKITTITKSDGTRSKKAIKGIAKEQSSDFELSDKPGMASVTIKAFALDS